MKLLAIAAVLMAATAAHAQEEFTTADCDQDAAEQKLMTASEAGAIQGVGMVNEIPSIAVDGAVWDHMDLDTRLGMIETFECFMAGPRNVLKEVQIVSPGGKVFAVFDGVSREIDVKR